MRQAFVTRARATVVQQKPGRPVQFELLELAPASILVWPERRGGTVDNYASPSRSDRTGLVGSRHYARLVAESVTGI